MSVSAFLPLFVGGFTTWYSLTCLIILSSSYVLWSKWMSTTLREPDDAATKVVEPRSSATWGKDDIVPEPVTTASREEDENIANITSTPEKRTRPDHDHAQTSQIDASKQKLAHTDYTVGWICALSIEYVAAQVFLDEKHEVPEYVHPNDNNDYTLGRVGRHNVVIAVLPNGEYGISSATSVAKDMLHSFPNIRIGLMVGIGGGAPSQKHDIRLGDVVVSAPRDGTGGVFQYDFGKAIQGGIFHTTGFLNQPPTLLRTAVNGLEADYEINGHQLEEAINGIFKEIPRLRRKYGRPLPATDRLYQSIAIHPSNTEESCVSCCGNYVSNIVLRADRTQEEDNPTIHYGLIASANQVMRDALIRDKLIKEKDVLCFEMEAAGLMNQFPCLVIRGICDYSDSHKNKEWQGYAAMAAAAYTSDLLSRIPTHKVEAEERITDILQSVQNGVEELLNVHQNEEHQRVFEWLTPIDYTPQQKDYISVRQPGTCHWFLGSREYWSWLQSDKQTLFCPGVPGAGKTIMSATVIDDLLYTRYKDDANVGIAYLYCDFRRQYEQKAQDLVANLLKQLAQKQITIPKCVQVLYEKYNGESRRPSLDELSEALSSVSSLYSKVFIIVDALDECQMTDGCRTNFLSKIFGLQAERNANIFATSRFIPEILEAFNQSACLEISAKDEDVQIYLDSHMIRLPSFVLRNPDLQNEIKATISNLSDGMFLLVRLHVDSLAQLPTVGHIKQTLRNLPRSLGKTYEHAMERIESQGEQLSQLAKKVIYWLVHARRILTITELQHAVAVEPGDLELDEEFIPDKEILSSICAGLVTIDAESDVMRLAHYTVQEYFKGEGKGWVQDAEADITTICLTYLFFCEFESGLCKTRIELWRRHTSNPLYVYAAENWGHHARASPEMKLVLDFLNTEAQVSAAGQMMQEFRGFNTPGVLAGGMAGIHLAAYFGLENIATYLLDNGHDINAMDGDGRTILFWAVNGEHQGMVKLLLDYGAKIDKRANDWGSTLWRAVLGENRIIIKLLLEIGADANAREENGWTPLFWASYYGHEDIVKLLLENGAEIDAGDNDGRTPLFWACNIEHENIIRLLLENGAEIDARDLYGRTPLLQASNDGRENIVKLLLANGAEVDARGNDRRTSLFLACIIEHEDIIKLLLENGAEIDAREENGWTPLLHASNDGRESIVKLLLANGAEIHITDDRGWTPLWWARLAGMKDIVRLLLEHGAPATDVYTESYCKMLEYCCGSE